MSAQAESGDGKAGAQRSLRPEEESLVLSVQGMCKKDTFLVLKKCKTDTVIVPLRFTFRQKREGNSPGNGRLKNQHSVAAVSLADKKGRSNDRPVTSGKQGQGVRRGRQL